MYVEIKQFNLLLNFIKKTQLCCGNEKQSSMKWEASVVGL